jgi:uncharacterized protein (TIGR02284 family)
MYETVIGIFDDYEDAQRGVDLLQDEGFGESEISVLMRDDIVRDRLGGDQIKTLAETAGAGAIGGTAVGGLIGLLAGASALMLPGVGGVLAAGTIATVVGTTTVGAGIGAAYGVFFGAVIGEGISEENVHRYVESVKRGGVLLAVETDQRRSLEAVKAMREANAMLVDTHPGKWQKKYTPGAEEAANQMPAETIEPRTIATLNNLIQTCTDSESDLRIAAQNVRDHELRRLLEKYTKKYEQFGLALRNQAQRLGRDSEPGGSITEGVKRGWLNIKAAMTIEEENTDLVVLEAIANSEAATLKIYREALDKGLPGELGSVVEAQFAEIEEMCSYISNISAGMEARD